MKMMMDVLKTKNTHTILWIEINRNRCVSWYFAIIDTFEHIDNHLIMILEFEQNTPNHRVKLLSNNKNEMIHRLFWSIGFIDRINYSALNCLAARVSQNVFLQNASTRSFIHNHGRFLLDLCVFVCVCMCLLNENVK